MDFPSVRFDHDTVTTDGYCHYDHVTGANKLKRVPSYRRFAPSNSHSKQFHFRNEETLLAKLQWKGFALDLRFVRISVNHLACVCVCMRANRMFLINFLTFFSIRTGSVLYNRPRRPRRRQLRVNVVHGRACRLLSYNVCSAHACGVAKFVFAIKIIIKTIMVARISVCAVRTPYTLCVCHSFNIVQSPKCACTFSAKNFSQIRIYSENDILFGIWKRSFGLKELQLHCTACKIYLNRSTAITHDTYRVKVICVMHTSHDSFGELSQLFVSRVSARLHSIHSHGFGFGQSTSGRLFAISHTCVSRIDRTLIAMPFRTIDVLNVSEFVWRIDCNGIDDFDIERTLSPLSFVIE